MSAGGFFPNTYPGKCTCGTWVKADAGKAEKIGGRWQVFCRHCPTPRDEENAAREGALSPAARGRQPLAWYREVLRDALAKPDRLSAWERTFCTNNQDRLTRMGERFSMTDDQTAALQQIEKKIYALS